MSARGVVEHREIEEYLLLTLHCWGDENEDFFLPTKHLAEAMMAALKHRFNSMPSFSGYCVTITGASGASSARFQVLLRLKYDATIRSLFKEDQQLEDMLFDEQFLDSTNFPLDQPWSWSEMTWTRLDCHLWHQLRDHATHRRQLMNDGAVYQQHNWRESSLLSAAARPHTP